MGHEVNADAPMLAGLSQAALSKVGLYPHLLQEAPRHPARMKKSVIKETVDKERDFFFSFTECLGNTSKQGDFFFVFWPHYTTSEMLVP